MALWDKLRHELDRAGRVAQEAIDEGRIKIDLLRARQLADKAAQALGYAVYEARTGGGDVDAETYGRLSATLAERQAEVKRLEDQLDSVRGGAATPADVAPGATAGTAAGAADTAGEGSGAGTPGDAQAASTTASAPPPRSDPSRPAGAPPTGTPPSAGTAPEEPWSPTI